MKNSAVVLSWFLCLGGLQAADRDSTNQHANAVGQSVLTLLETRDVERFANERSVSNQYNRKEVSDSARLVLEQGARMGLEPANVHFRIKEVLAKATGTGKDPQSNTGSLPTSFGIKIILRGEPVRGAAKVQRGEYELGLGGAFEYPDGWRTYEGIRWIRFPERAADERTRQEVALVSNIVCRVGAPLHVADDPALGTLGNTLMRFLRQRDEKILKKETMPIFEDRWQALLKKLKESGAKELPTKKE